MKWPSRQTLSRRRFQLSKRPAPKGKLSTKCKRYRLCKPARSWRSCSSSTRSALQGRIYPSNPRTPCPTKPRFSWEGRWDEDRISCPRAPSPCSSCILWPSICFTRIRRRSSSCGSCSRRRACGPYASTNREQRTCSGSLRSVYPDSF